jgi:hypothetical protein
MRDQRNARSGQTALLKLALMCYRKVGSVISLCFAAGALLGGVCTLGLADLPLLPVVVLAAAGTLLTIRERQRRLELING